MVPKYLSFIHTGGLFTKTELSEVLTEIVKMDPTFEKEKFLHMCRDEFIPNILEVSNVQFRI